MVRYIFFIIIIFFSTDIIAQRSVKKVFRECRQGEKVIKLTIPGFVFKLGRAIAKNHLDDDPEAQIALELMKYIRKMKLQVYEGQNAVNPQKLSKQFKKIEAVGFEHLIRVNSEGSTVRIMMREKKNEIRNLLIVVTDEEDLVLVHLKTKISYKKLTKLIKKWIKASKEKKEKEKKKEKTKEEQDIYAVA